MSCEHCKNSTSNYCSNCMKKVGENENYIIFAKHEDLPQSEHFEMDILALCLPSLCRKKINKKNKQDIIKELNILINN